MKFGVLQFPGSCDEVDALSACERVGEAKLIWHRDSALGDVDADPDADVGAALCPRRGGGERDGERRDGRADHRESCHCRHDDLRPVARAAPI